jgi:predicted  nucleic acid-binding Zn-ribbon protein
LNADLKSLLDIQEFDKRAAILDEELEKIQKKEEKILDVIDVKQEQLKIAKEDKEAIEKDKVFKEELLADTLENLKKLETKLNSATNEKQMQAVNTEIEIAKTNKSVLEEKIVSLEEEIESKDKDIRELEDRYAQLQKTLNEHKAKFNARREEINKEIQQIKESKAKLIDTVDPDLLDKYEKLNRWTKGTSIVPVREGACYGCFMKLTPQTLANIEETDEIIYCPICGRMLYKEDESVESDKD